MSVIDLLAQLTHKDIRLWLENDQLRFSAPKNALNEHLRDQIRHQKNEIVDFLSRKATAINYQIEAVNPQQPQPLSSAQERIWFLNQLAPNNPAFHIQCAFDIHGPLHIPRLEACLNHIIQRHNILRTAYIHNENGLFQKVLPQQQIQLTAKPSSAKNSTEAIAEIQRTTHTEFDLSQGDVLDYTLLQLNNDHFILHCSLHHIAGDGWSMTIMADEIMSLI